MLKSLLDTQVLMVVAGVLAAVAAGCAFLWSKHPVRWVLALAAVAWVVVVLMFDVSSLDLDPRLPGEFAHWLRPWVLALGLVVLGAGAHLASLWIGPRFTPQETAEGGAFADLDDALEEIDVRLSQAHYDAGAQGVFLLLSRDEALAADLVRAAGLNLFATAPTSPDAPVHAYASADGLFLSCAGAASWGRGEGDGAARLGRVCEWIGTLHPEMPPLRGVAVLTPLEDAASSEALKTIGPLRSDLQAIQARLAVRCPVIAVFCLRDGRSGFGEFAARMPATLRDNRCGFSTPGAQPFDHKVADKGLRWFVQWLQTWSLNLQVQDYPAMDGNGRLVELNSEMRRDLPALRTLLETAFSTHAKAEPLMVRGCYFALCGPEAADRAFAAGLLRGPRSKMVADARLTTWAREAGAVDAAYRRAALALAVGAIASAAAVWTWGIVPRLKAVAPGASSGMGWVAWAGPAAIAIVWAVSLLASRLRRRPAAVPT